MPHVTVPRVSFLVFGMLVASSLATAVPGATPRASTLEAFDMTVPAMPSHMPPSGEETVGEEAAEPEAMMIIADTPVDGGVASAVPGASLTSGEAAIVLSDVPLPMPLVLLLSSLCGLILLGRRAPSHR